NEFIRLSVLIEFSGANNLSSILDYFESENEKDMSKEAIKKEAFLRFAEVLVGYKSYVRKVKEIERLQRDVEYLNVFFE
ncbi:MAG: hypothetical protein ABIA74_03710, partial [bacterium]